MEHYKGLQLLAALLLASAATLVTPIVEGGNIDVKYVVMKKKAVAGSSAPETEIEMKMEDLLTLSHFDPSKGIDGFRRAVRTQLKREGRKWELIENPIVNAKNKKPIENLDGVTQVLVKVHKRVHVYWLTIGAKGELKIAFLNSYYESTEDPIDHLWNRVDLSAGEKKKKHAQKMATYEDGQTPKFFRIISSGVSHYHPVRPWRDRVGSAVRNLFRGTSSEPVTVPQPAATSFANLADKHPDRSKPVKTRAEFDDLPMVKGKNNHCYAQLYAEMVTGRREVPLSDTEDSEAGSEDEEGEGDDDEDDQ